MSPDRRTGPVGGGRFESDLHDDGIEAHHTSWGVTFAVPGEDPVSAAVELLEALGPSACMTLVAELARLVVDVEPTLIGPMRFLVAGALS